MRFNSLLTFKYYILYNVITSSAFKYNMFNSYTLLFGKIDINLILPENEISDFFKKFKISCK